MTGAGGPKITVAIPAHNSSAVIGMTLESVFAQTTAPHEILVLDDGSTDGTAGILDSFKPRITVILQPNRGVAAARNRLCAEAKGDLIAFLDHDDIWHPEYLAVQSRQFAEHPEAAAFFTAHLTFEGYGGYRWAGRPVPPRASRLLSPARFLREYNTSSGTFLSMSFCCVPKRVLSQIGEKPFCERASGVDDCYLCNLLPLYGPVAFAPQALVAYRITPEAQSSDHLRLFRKAVDACGELEGRYAERAKPQLARLFHRAFAAKRRHYGKILMGAGRTGEARTEFAASIARSKNLPSRLKSLSLLAASFLPAALQPAWPAGNRMKEKNPMEILYSFPLRLGRPGIGMTAWHQIDSLTRAGVKVHLVAGSVERPIRGLASCRETLFMFGIPLPVSLIGAERARGMHDRKAARCLSRRGTTIQAVHCWPSGCKETLQAAREKGVVSFLERPSSYTPKVLETMERVCREEGVALGANHYAAFDPEKIRLENEEFALADYLLCPSAYALKTHEEGGIPAGKLLNHRYGFDPEVFFPDPDNTFLHESVRGLFVGEGNPMKGIRYALEAWFDSGLHEKGVFTICGRILPEYEARLARWLDHPSVERIGFTDDVARYMREADFLVLPSLSEGSSLVAFEARACGCCILVSDASGAYCENGVTALVHKAGDVGTLASHMRRFVTDPEGIQAIRKNSVADIKKYSWDESVGIQAKLYSGKPLP